MASTQHLRMLLLRPRDPLFPSVLGPKTFSRSSWKAGEGKQEEMTEPAVRSWRFGVANRTRFLCAEKTTPFLRSIVEKSRVLLNRNELNDKVQLV